MTGTDERNRIMEGVTIEKAREEQTESIHQLVSRTIREIYSRYYHEEAVRFFLEYHNPGNIAKDIAAGKTWVAFEDGKIAATGTADGNHIYRLFTLPEYQGRGIGTALMNMLEEVILRQYDSVELDASLPAGEFYRKRNYRQTGHGEHPVENGKILSYEMMEKRKD